MSVPIRAEQKLSFDADGDFISSSSRSASRSSDRSSCRTHFDRKDLSERATRAQPILLAAVLLADRIASRSSRTATRIVASGMRA